MDNSPLNRLPPEIRNRIYGLALAERGPVVSEYGRRIESRSVVVEPAPPKHRLALTKTCKEVRRDSIKMYFAVNTFYIIIKDDELLGRSYIAVTRLLAPLPSTSDPEAIGEITLEWDRPFGDYCPQLAWATTYFNDCIFSKYPSLRLKVENDFWDVCSGSMDLFTVNLDMQRPKASVEDTLQSEEYETLSSRCSMLHNGRACLTMFDLNNSLRDVLRVPDPVVRRD
ncbi:hypothetical protein B0A50_04119 [Salinomyces thailandicus]|uniref:Uncharacterized protein n=1 Tax=Salinomyces thailandicus TaxID=706561 RepID=A0A4U0U052_9PEZI|nr:hypothetical protein B0A50_04119 [Salinomyces thailandica]